MYYQPYIWSPFTAAIEAKQVAAQEAECAKFLVERAEQEKRSAII
jgi:prohibitin 1